MAQYLPIWYNITTPGNIQSWLFRRNKKHYQQVCNDCSLCVTRSTGSMFDSFNNPEILHEYLEDDLSIDASARKDDKDSLVVPYYARNWLKSFQITLYEKSQSPLTVQFPWRNLLKSSKRQFRRIFFALRPALHTMEDNN